MIKKTISRSKFITGSSALFFGGLSLQARPNAEDPALVAHELKLLGEMATGGYQYLWEKLAGITDDELDWKPNKEANSVRWIVGHICWFEEYFADTLGDRKGRYLTDKKPMSINDEPYEKVKQRFDAARKQTAQRLASLTPAQSQQIVKFVDRFDVTLKDMAYIYVEHMGGHTYQIRYVRGTYSRVFKTNKALFDPW
jgi:hypothetical protein